MNYFSRSISTVFILGLLVFQPAFVAAEFNFDDYMEDLGAEIEAGLQDRTERSQTHYSMRNRQYEVGQSFIFLNERIAIMIDSDPRKNQAEVKLALAESDRDDFLDINVDNNIEEDPYRPSDDFNEKEKAALTAITEINRTIIAPARPGNVPEGDIVEDFIPQFIRLLFRFVSLAVFISFVVSGIMFVMAFGNEERITKAKSMLYWSLMGFAFVTLAFAIIKAITDIDFFGFM